MELLGQLVQVRDLILDPVELGRGVPLIACLALALSQVTLDQGQCRQCSFQADRQSKGTYLDPELEVCPDIGILSHHDQPT